jgi:MYXO-CTERM domain-containing protein
MPVDQTGENIVIVMEPGKVEAHIQIQYKGEPDKFSWILPVQALPEVEVGSQALFDRLLQATVPTYSVTTQFDSCSVSNGFTSGSTGNFGSSAGAGGSGGKGADGPTVVLQKTVGAFEVTVLMGGTTPEVIQWLTDNQYQVPPNASQLLDGYVANHFLFVAVKLTGGAGISEIHPLVIRYPGNNPCVPLKLTSVAAVEDMGIRTFFLGTKRVVPKNYKHVVPNLAKLDWFNATTSYATLVGRAVDSPLANGQAWVTEYAGPAAIVGASPIASPNWNAAPFATSAAVGVIQLLQNQGFLDCSSAPIRPTTGGAGGAPIYGGCTYNHPLLLPLLRQYLPIPAALTVNGNQLVDPTLIEAYFYSCLACYQDQIDQTKWNGPAFASDLAKRIIDPSRHADALLTAWPYLTRLFTTMSPVEMTQDPEFLERQGLGDVSVIRLNATQRITCQSTAGMTLPDGKSIALPMQGKWPLFPDKMPWAERVEEIPATGVPIVLADNRAAIDTELKSWNDSQSWPPPGTTGSGTGAGPGLTTGGTGGTSGNDLAPGNNNGCGCRTVASPRAAALPWAMAALLGLAGAVRRRRRT